MDALAAPSALLLADDLDRQILPQSREQACSLLVRFPETPVHGDLVDNQVRLGRLAARSLHGLGDDFPER